MIPRIMFPLEHITYDVAVGCNGTKGHLKLIVLFLFPHDHRVVPLYHLAPDFSKLLDPHVPQKSNITY